jgi:hypothetical protein
MFPNPKNDINEDEDEDEYNQTGKQPAGDKWEMQPPASARSIPFTPRTQAFHTLERKLPLRQNYA